MQPYRPQHHHSLRVVLMHESWVKLDAHAYVLMYTWLHVTQSFAVLLHHPAPEKPGGESNSKRVTRQILRHFDRSIPYIRM